VTDIDQTYFFLTLQKISYNTVLAKRWSAAENGNAGETPFGKPPCRRSVSPTNMCIGETLPYRQVGELSHNWRTHIDFFITQKQAFIMWLT